jgi:transposase
MSAVRGRRIGSAPRAPAALQVRETAVTLLAEGGPDEALDYFTTALAEVLHRNTELELLLAKLRRHQLGKSSEKITAEQLALLLEGLQQLEGEAEPDPLTEAEEEAKLEQEIELAEAAERDDRRKERSRKRDWQARGVERQIHQVALPSEERVCAACGREKRQIGADTTRVLEFVPAHFVEHEYHLEKYACGSCKVGVSTAAGPVKVIERSAADASVLAHVVVSKYADHTPLHRLHRIYDRSGVDIPVSTLADWVAGLGARIQPLVDVLAQRVLQAEVVRTDATGLKVLDPTSPENIERGTMWCYVGDDRDVVFRYTPTGDGASGPWSFLTGRRGYIQADAASVFDRLFNGQAASATEVGCWAHARRRFVDLAETDCRVAYALQLIRRLYRVEHLADAQRLSREQRAKLRGERSVVILDKLKRWLVTTYEKELPSSALTKAAGYCLNQWTALTRFVDDGRLSLDNNLCEQQLRDIALGRKNYLFAGSHDAARRTAAIYSLMRTCAQHGVPPLPWLTDVLRKLANGWEATRLDELLPDRWQQLYGSADSTASVTHQPQPVTV